MKGWTTFFLLLFTTMLYANGVEEDIDVTYVVNDLDWVEYEVRKEIPIPYVVPCDNVEEIYRTAYDGLNINWITFNGRRLKPRRDRGIVEPYEDKTKQLFPGSEINILLGLWMASWDQGKRYFLDVNAYKNKLKGWVVQVPAKNGVVQMSYTVLLPNGCVSEEAVVQWTQYFE